MLTVSIQLHNVFLGFTAVLFTAVNKLQKLKHSMHREECTVTLANSEHNSTKLKTMYNTRSVYNTSIKYAKRYDYVHTNIRHKIMLLKGRKEEGTGVRFLRKAQKDKNGED